MSDLLLDALKDSEWLLAAELQLMDVAAAFRGERDGTKKKALSIELSKLRDEVKGLREAAKAAEAKAAQTGKSNVVAFDANRFPKSS